MRTSRFSDSQSVAILKEPDAGMKMQGLCRKHGISDATYYKRPIALSHPKVLLGKAAPG